MNVFTLFILSTKITSSYKSSNLFWLFFPSLHSTSSSGRPFFSSLTCSNCLRQCFSALLGSYLMKTKSARETEGYMHFSLDGEGEVLSILCVYHRWLHPLGNKTIYSDILRIVVSQRLREKKNENTVVVRIGTLRQWGDLLSYWAKKYAG